MTEVKKYKAYDGMEFDNAEECLAHEKFLDTRSKIEKFVEVIANECKTHGDYCKECPYYIFEDNDCLFYHTPETWTKFFNI